MPHIPLIDTLSNIVCAAFKDNGLPAEYGIVRLSDRPDLAQFQCNGALPASKKMGRNPRDVATQIADTLAQNPLFKKVEVAGPGFINLDITDAAIAAAITDMKADPFKGVAQTGAGQVVLLDYGGPNAAKAMHVGHLRTAIVGDTLRRILIATGHQAIGDIHLGDDGLQAGMVISELEIRYPDWPYFTPGKTDGFPDTFPIDFDTLTDIYPAASADAKASPERMARAKRATFDLQQGHPGYNALWKNIVDMSCASMRKNYGALNVFFDLWTGEKGVSPLTPSMVHDLEKRGFAVPSEGATIINVAKNDDKKEVPPLILIKSDGAYLYPTTDLATLIDRGSTSDHPKLNRCIYVVDQRQSLHFEQVFRAAYMTGIASKNLDLTFAGIGTMNGTDGKPFKTRAGGVLRLQDLIQMGIDKANARMAESHIGDELDSDEKNAIAQKIAVAAIKFADLKNPRHVDYVFDMDAMTTFEGKTGPYLIYQAVRIHSILKTAKDKGFEPTSIAVDETTRSLALLIADYPNIIQMVTRELSAHILADYLYRLAQEFSAFYNRCHIMNEPDAQRRGNWLSTCIATRDILEHGLSLMGIDVPDRM